MNIKARLKRLESAQVRRRVVPLAYPSPEAAMAAGVRGGWLQIGPVMTREEWERIAPAQQAALLRTMLH